MADKIFTGRVKLKKDTKTNFETQNPVLLNGEIGIATSGSRYQLKCGNGSSTWNALPAIDANDKKQADWNTNNGVKNLLECIKDGYLYPYRNYGITVTVDKLNGSATFNGTATRQLTFYVQRGSLDTSKSFKLTGCPTGGNYDSGYSLYVAAGSSIYAIDDGNGVEFTPQTDHTDISVLIRSGTTLNNVVFKPMLRYDFIEDSTFVPYAMNNAEITAVIGDINSVLEGVL